MNRRFSSMIGRTPSSPAPPYPPPVFHSPHAGNIDKEDDATTLGREEPLQPPSLKIKRVDHYYSKWYKEWRYRNTNSKSTAESLSILSRGSNDPWKDFSFVFVRKMAQIEGKDPNFKVIIKSEYLLQACKDVIGYWPGISWNADPLELDPEIFITFLDEFTEYRDNLAAKKKTPIQSHILASVNLLLSFLHSEYQATIRLVNQHKQHRETTFDMFYALLVPRTLLVARCAVTGSPRMFQLISWARATVENKSCYQLDCESMDLLDNQSTGTIGVGRVQATILIPTFKGTVAMDDLDIYPVRYHPEPQKLKDNIMKRGKKWRDLIGLHHKEFDGIAAFKKDDCGLERHAVKGRIMVDRVSFRRFNTNYRFPIPAYTHISADPTPPPPLPPMDAFGHFLPPHPMPLPTGQYANGTVVRSQAENPAQDGVSSVLSDEELLLTPTVVYGFSLADKLWLEFDVEKVAEVQWNQDAFSNLVLPDDRKHLLKSLVEAHHMELGFDDFIKGKGHGLVVNLFGPPGVGKTFSAEATSEHVKRPLYLVGAGDLGTKPSDLDKELERVFQVATSWKAIVLIDEADVFLEQRSLHDLHRNAMVAVFLRHVEYYRGILFLTTNRVKAFDEAFLSRIHVALHFKQLPLDSKIQIWQAFIAKVGATKSITAEQIQALAKRDVNGRQIKNAARTAQSLAVGKGEKLGFSHFEETLDAMEEFARDFEAIRSKK